MICSLQRAHMHDRFSWYRLEVCTRTEIEPHPAHPREYHPHPHPVTVASVPIPTPSL